MSAEPKPYPVTPDGRYFVVRGRLWRCTNPKLDKAEREHLTRELMDGCRAIAWTKRIALGERGPVWWDDGSPDYNRRMAWNTPYRDWYAEASNGTAVSATSPDTGQ